MRGPRNILRTCAEFALEHRKDCEVFCGSFTEIVAAMYEYGMATLTPSPALWVIPQAMRAFRKPSPLPLGLKTLRSARSSWAWSFPRVRHDGLWTARSNPLFLWSKGSSSLVFPKFAERIARAGQTFARTRRG